MFEVRRVSDGQLVYGGPDRAIAQAYASGQAPSGAATDCPIDAGYVIKLGIMGAAFFLFGATYERKKCTAEGIRIPARTR